MVTSYANAHKQHDANKTNKINQRALNKTYLAFVYEFIFIFFFI